MVVTAPPFYFNRATSVDVVLGVMLIGLGVALNRVLQKRRDRQSRSLGTQPALLMTAVGLLVAAATVGALFNLGLSARAEGGQTDSRAQAQIGAPAVPYYGLDLSAQEHNRRVYGRMNQRAEELRREVNKRSPDPGVVADLKGKLRSLSRQLAL